MAVPREQFAQLQKGVFCVLAPGRAIGRRGADVSGASEPADRVPHPLPVLTEPPTTPWLSLPNAELLKGVRALAGERGTAAGQRRGGPASGPGGETACHVAQPALRGPD